LLLYYQTTFINTEAYTGSYLHIYLNKLVLSNKILNLYILSYSVHFFLRQPMSGQF